MAIIRSTKISFLLVLVLGLFLAACGASTPEGGSASVDSPTSGYESVQVDGVDVEMGEGSPLPVFARISLSLPDSCAQLEHFSATLVDSNFTILLSTTSTHEEGCIQDTIPMYVRIPLNVVHLPAGTYAIATLENRTITNADGSVTMESSGISTAFAWDIINESAVPWPAGAELQSTEATVHDVAIQVGVGSPIRVHAIISGDLPTICSQISELRLRREDQTFYLQVFTQAPADVECLADALPFRLEVPLNTIPLESGNYEVLVNGVSTTFEYPFAP